jgi:hypothetical protein
MLTLNLDTIIAKDAESEGTLSAFMDNLTSEEKLKLAKFALAKMSFNVDDLRIPPASIIQLENLRNDYRIKEASAQLEISLTGDKTNAKALLVLSGYIECLNFITTAARANNDTVSPTTEEKEGE